MKSFLSILMDAFLFRENDTLNAVAGTFFWLFVTVACITAIGTYFIAQ